MRLKLLFINIFCNIYLNIVISYTIIDQQNCVSGKIFYDQCLFMINIHGLINNTINCTLKFNDNNTKLNFTNKIISIKPQAENKCPGFDLTLKTVPREYKLSTTCGGQIEELYKSFSNFTESVFVYDNKGLADRETKINFNMTVDDEKCKDKKTGFDLRYLIVLPVIAVIIIIVMIVIFILKKGKSKNKEDKRKNNEDKRKNNEDKSMNKEDKRKNNEDEINSNDIGTSEQDQSESLLKKNEINSNDIGTSEQDQSESLLKKNEKESNDKDT